MGLSIGTAVVGTVVCVLAYTSHFVWRSTVPPVSQVSPNESFTTAPNFLSKYSANTHNPRVLNVHMVPHTHDDVGWLKTVEQYYEAHANDTIDSRGNVRNILSSSMQALLEHDARTFVWVETKFMIMWWKEQTDAVKDTVRYLVAQGQLSFVNGGYCMHDEASTHFIGMVDQTTLGHMFLERELGVVPTVGWQLDPFGHSATQASLLTARTGLDALYFGRIDYQDLELRRQQRECEGLWDASKGSAQENGFDATVFWGLTGSYQGNYGPPSGFWFDVLTPDNEPIVGMDDEEKRMERIMTFLNYLKEQADETQGNHIMLTLGSDFHYREAHYNFGNYDMLISLIMAYQHWGTIDIPNIFGPQYDEINVFYSSPEYYTKMKHQQTRNHDGKGPSNSSSMSIQWSVKRDDFFPYSDCPHCFWTGYFTSRAAFKRFERVASAFLLAARQIEAKPAADSVHGQQQGRLTALEDALAVAQHHDAISGTAKQHVADDYSKRVQAGLDEAALMVIDKLKSIMLEEPSSDLKDLMFCQRLNETVCEIAEKATAGREIDLIVLVYNALAAEPSSTIVRLPVASKAKFRIELIGEKPKVQIAESVLDPRSHFGEKYVLFFNAVDLPPAGAAAYRISLYEGDEWSAANRHQVRNLRDKEQVVISNGNYEVILDRSTGLVRHISAPGGPSLEVEQTWGYYTSFDSSFDHADESPRQNSGAYIFRPSKPQPELVRLYPQSATFIHSSLGTEVHTSFQEPWMHQVTRILDRQPYIEVEYTVGPIPIDDGRGKEIVTRWMTPIESDGVFYTDSNGREFQRRQRDYRPTWNIEVFEPVAGNYYPVNAAIFMKDSNAAFAVLTDRTQGGASLWDGSLELMVQRRTLVDDGRGVDEPMNETVGGMTAYPPYGDATRIGDGVVIRGVHRIMVGESENAELMVRSVMDETFAQPLIFAASTPKASPAKFHQPSYSLLSSGLPKEVMLITFAELPRNESSNKMFLLRLGHQLDYNEGSAKPITVDLTQLFIDYEIVQVVERTLTGNQDWDDFTKRRLVWQTGHHMVSHHPQTPSTLDPKAIILQPMDIRTFHLAVKGRI